MCSVSSGGHIDILIRSIYEEGKSSYNTNTIWSKWAFILALSVMMKLDHVNKPYSATITVDHMAFLTLWSISV